jgi:hypothetical protein
VDKPVRNADIPKIIKPVKSRVIRLTRVAIYPVNNCRIAERMVHAVIIIAAAE